MIALPDNQAVVRIVEKMVEDEATKTVEGAVFRTQTGRKLVKGEGKDDKHKYVDERLVSIRDSEGVEHTFNLDTEVESLTVIKERKDAQADADALLAEGDIVAEEGREAGA